VKKTKHGKKLELKSAKVRMLQGALTEAQLKALAGGVGCHGTTDSGGTGTTQDPGGDGC
jgi:hypothetical protein